MHRSLSVHKAGLFDNDLLFSAIFCKIENAQEMQIWRIDTIQREVMA